MTIPLSFSELPKTVFGVNVWITSPVVATKYSAVFRAASTNCGRKNSFDLKSSIFFIAYGDALRDAFALAASTEETTNALIFLPRTGTVTIDPTVTGCEVK